MDLIIADTTVFGLDELERRKGRRWMESGQGRECESEWRV